eukprot:TRINITY_DN6386_c0_g1_i4.p1 TRINITY_DN6386_c0_g1~~TRINITY_DN6386_c0_g1_i4.p1  ORF type:complete len:770 (+),score=169.83 TRINITY_DN6386_c0_g1_i4:237-2546(+)
MRLLEEGDDGHLGTVLRVLVAKHLDEVLFLPSNTLIKEHVHDVAKGRDGDKVHKDDLKSDSEDEPSDVTRMASELVDSSSDDVVLLTLLRLDDVGESRAGGVHSNDTDGEAKDGEESSDVVEEPTVLETREDAVEEEELKDAEEEGDRVLCSMVDEEGVARQFAGVVDGGEDVLEEVEEREEDGVETKAVVVLREGVEADADSKGASEEEGLERGCAVASLVELWPEPGKLRKEGVVHDLLVLFDERRDLVLECCRHLLCLLPARGLLLVFGEGEKDEEKGRSKKTKANKNKKNTHEEGQRRKKKEERRMSDAESSSSSEEEEVIPVELFRMLTRPGSSTLGQLIAILKVRGVLVNERVERVYRQISRAEFVVPSLASEAFHDNPIRCAEMCFNISAPHMHIICLQQLDLKPGDMFLDIGSGCGHLTLLGAALIQPGGRAHGLECREDISDFGRMNVEKFFERHPDQRLTDITFEHRNCFLPDLEERVWDKIHVGACCPESRLEDLCRLLAPGGILITPFGDNLVKIKKALDGSTTQENVTQVRYGDLVIPSAAEVKEAEKQLRIKRATTVKVPPDTLLGDLASLVDSPRFSDVKLLVKDGKIIHAHKLLLQLRSRHFEIMFQSGMREASENVVHIENFQKTTMLKVVRFLYTGAIGEHADDDEDDEEDAAEVLEASLFFELERLTAIYETYFQQRIDVDNVVNLYTIADRYSSSRLKASCATFIINNFAQVSRTPAIRQLSPDQYVELLSLSCGDTTSSSSSSSSSLP